MERNIGYEFIKATEAAAIAAYNWVGKGEEKAADQAAVDAMRAKLNEIHCDATIVIGEGERDEAPMLYIGEKVGRGEGEQLEIALDPLEGTTICATANANSISVMAVAKKGGLLHAPDVYMDKLAVGPQGKGVVHLEKSPTENINALAAAMKRSVEEIIVVVLDRPRHADLIREVRSTGARIHLIGDGDVAAAIHTCNESSAIDLLLGVGGAPEGVLAAAAMKCTGGDFMGRLIFKNEEQKKRAQSMGVQDPDKIYQRDDLVSGPVLFCATGVTHGNILRGVKLKRRRYITHSILMESESLTTRYIESHYQR